MQFESVCRGGRGQISFFLFYFLSVQCSLNWAELLSEDQQLSSFIIAMKTAAGRQFAVWKCVVTELSSKMVAALGDEKCIYNIGLMLNFGS